MPDFAPGPASAFAAAFQAHIDMHMEEASMEREQRDYLGGSRLGIECERALFYEYTHTPKDPERNFKGPILRTFEFGHKIEALLIGWMQLAGFELITERADGGQMGFWIAPHPETGRARVAGHIDGVVTKAPADILFATLAILVPCLAEFKSMNAKNWAKTLKNGVKRAKPEYYVQMQTYMAYLGLTEHPALFVALNKDTSEIYAELVPFDLATAQAASDKGARVVSAGEPEHLARIAADRSDFRCKFCDYAATCWKTPATLAGPVAAALPGWGTPA